MIGEVQREGEKERLELDEGKEEEEEGESPYRARPSLFSLTMNSSSSGNPVPQDTSI